MCGKIYTLFGDNNPFIVIEGLRVLFGAEIKPVLQAANEKNVLYFFRIPEGYKTPQMAIQTIGTRNIQVDTSGSFDQINLTIPQNLLPVITEIGKNLKPLPSGITR